METFEHVLPKWFLRFNATIGLSGLLAADMYLLGNMFIYGWVHDVGNIQEYLNLQGAGIPIFFVAGVSLGGIGILASAASAMAFAAGKKARGFWIMLGAVIFMLFEIWASISERSQNVPVTKADTWLLGLANAQGALLSPTLIVIALALPFGSFLFAFVQVKAKENTETLEQQKLRQDRALAELEYKQKRAQLQAKGFVKVVQTAANAARGIEETPEQIDTNPTANMNESSDSDTANTEETEEQTSGKPATKAGIPNGYVDKWGLLDYAVNELGYSGLSADDMLTIIKETPGARQIAAQGNPWIAPRNDARKLARKKYPKRQAIRLVSDRKRA